MPVIGCCYCEFILPSDMAINRILTRLERARWKNDYDILTELSALVFGFHCTSLRLVYLFNNFLTFIVACFTALEFPCFSSEVFALYSILPAVKYIPQFQQEIDVSRTQWSFVIKTNEMLEILSLSQSRHANFKNEWMSSLIKLMELVRLSRSNHNRQCINFERGMMVLAWAGFVDSAHPNFLFREYWFRFFRAPSRYFLNSTALPMPTRRPEWVVCRDAFFTQHNTSSTQPCDDDGWWISLPVRV